MIKFSKIIAPSMYLPSKFFTEMITTTQSFRDPGVNRDDLYELIEAVIDRANKNEVGFEHL
jgi:hypothetical protein